MPLPLVRHHLDVCRCGSCSAIRAADLRCHMATAALPHTTATFAEAAAIAERLWDTIVDSDRDRLYGTFSLAVFTACDYPAATHYWQRWYIANSRPVFSQT